VKEGTAAQAARTPSVPPARLPLSALLSQALVAFTIEADNETEHRLPHRTQTYGLASGSATRRPVAHVGADRVTALRQALEPLVAGDPSPLDAGLIPHPDNWRARVQPPATLPHYPMTLPRAATRTAASS
jgi:hypothetical protein